MTQGKDDRGYYFERNVDVRLKKQDQKYNSNYIFLLVLLALSIYFIIQAVLDSRSQTEIVNIKKDTVKNTVVYSDDSFLEQKKFTGMQARFFVFNKDNEDRKKEVLAKLRKAEKKFGKSFDQAQKVHGEGIPKFRSLVKTIAIIESNLDTKAVSDAGAKGVMQIMPVNFHFLGIKNPFDSTQNIMGGAKMLRQLLDKHNGDYTFALAEYNGGNFVLTHNGFSLETKNFIARAEHILKYMDS